MKCVVCKSQNAKLVPIQREYRGKPLAKVYVPYCSLHTPKNAHLRVAPPLDAA